jgi:hypothetical protein
MLAWRTANRQPLLVTLSRNSAPPRYIFWGSLLISEFSRGLTVPQLYSTSYIICVSASLSSYACTSHGTHACSKAHYALCSGYHTFWITFITNPITKLISYTNDDWGGCPDIRRSTSSYCVFLGVNLISWSSKRQLTLSHYSAEAEYRGVTNVVSESCWIRNLLMELHFPIPRASLVCCDNVSVVYLSIW